MLHNFSMTGASTETPLASVFEWGWVGVQLFFVLSGFLITRILFDTRRVPGALTAFMVRRALRLVPLYYATLLLYFVVLPRFIHAPTVSAAMPQQVWYWAYLSNWSEPFGRAAPGLGHFWSLAIEAQFYVLWPLLVSQLDERRLVRFCLAIAFIAMVFSIALRLVAADSVAAVYKITLTRMGAPALGALVAVVAWRSDWQLAFIRHARSGVLVLVAALAGLVVWRSGFSARDAVVQGIGFTLVAVIFAAWMFAIVTGLPVWGRWTIAWPSSPFLRALGRLSYGMYVIHYPLHWAAMKPLHTYLLTAPGWLASLRLAVYMLAAMLVTYGLAWISWNLFERHFLALKRHFPAGREMPARVVAVGAAGQEGSRDRFVNERERQQAEREHALDGRHEWLARGIEHGGADERDHESRNLDCHDAGRGAPAAAARVGARFGDEAAREQQRHGVASHDGRQEQTDVVLDEQRREEIVEDFPFEAVEREGERAPCGDDDGHGLEPESERAPFFGSPEHDVGACREHEGRQQELHLQERPLTQDDRRPVGHEERGVSQHRPDDGRDAVRAVAARALLGGESGDPQQDGRDET